MILGAEVRAAFTEIRIGLARACVAVAVAGLIIGAGVHPADAEFQFGIYGGWSESLDSDVELVQPNGTNMTLSDVDWDGKSFTFDGGPPFYGLRLIYWKERNPSWGIMLDYNHAKVKPNLAQTVAVSGTRNGVPVAGAQPLNQTVSLLEFTDGLNLLTLNLMHRKQRDGVTPYGGIGIGLSIPNVEFSRANSLVQTDEYQITGVAFQALVGLEMNMTDRVSAFGEYKVNYSMNDADLQGGGTLETDIWTNSLLFGLSYKFSRPASPSFK